MRPWVRPSPLWVHISCLEVGVHPCPVPPRVTMDIKCNSARSLHQLEGSLGIRGVLLPWTQGSETCLWEHLCTPCSDASWAFEKSGTCHPGILLVLAATQKVTSSWPISLKSRAASASSYRACVGLSMEWRFHLLGEGCQSTWGIGGREGGRATVVQGPAWGPAEVGDCGGGGLCPGSLACPGVEPVLQPRSSPPRPPSLLHTPGRPLCRADHL